MEAIDKKHSFPAPTVRQRRTARNTPKASKASSASGSEARPSEDTEAAAQANDGRATSGEVARRERVISPELRHLLSKEVERLGKSEVVEHGGGIGA